MGRKESNQPTHSCLEAYPQGFFQQFWEKAPGQNWEKNDQLNIKIGRNKRHWT